MSAWGINFFGRLRLRLMKKHTNKLRVMSHKYLSVCVSDIKESYDKFLKLFEEVREELIKLSKKIVMSERKKDKLGNIVEVPIEFVQSEIEKQKSAYRKYWFLMILFVGAETCLYYITMDIIAGEVGSVAKWGLSFLIAFLSILCFYYFFESHTDYLYYKNNKEKLNINDADVKSKYHGALFGYFIGFLGLSITILAAIVRIMYIEHIDTTGMTPEEISFANQINTIVTALIIVVTLAIALVLGYIKYSSYEQIYEYKAYKKWKRIIKRVNKFKQVFIKVKKNIDEHYKILIEENWQLVKELERIWGIDVDEQNMDLYKKLKDEKNRGTFVLNESTYSKYGDVINADKGLFEFAVRKETDIQNILDDTNTKFADVMSLPNI